MNAHSITAEEYLITLSVPPALEEAMVDCLLTFEAEDGFVSFPVNAHDHRNTGLSIVEQVSGRQRKIRFQFYLPAADLPVFLERLRSDFSDTGIHYWILPVIRSGRL